MPLDRDFSCSDSDDYNELAHAGGRVAGAAENHQPMTKTAAAATAKKVSACDGDDEEDDAEDMHGAMADGIDDGTESDDEAADELEWVAARVRQVAERNQQRAASAKATVPGSSCSNATAATMRGNASSSTPLRDNLECNADSGNIFGLADDGCVRFRRDSDDDDDGVDDAADALSDCATAPSRMTLVDEDGEVNEAVATTGRGGDHQNDASFFNRIPASRQTFNGAVVSHYAPYGFATHYLLSVPDTGLSLVGPCAVHGLSGTVSMNGISLKQKTLVLPNASAAGHCMKVAASQKKKQQKQTTATKRISRDAPSNDPSISVKPWPTPSGSQVLACVEAHFGPIDWQWVHKSLSSKKAAVGSVPAMVLVLCHNLASPHRQHHEGPFSPSQNTTSKTSTGALPQLYTTMPIAPRGKRPPRPLCPTYVPFPDQRLLGAPLDSMTAHPYSCIGFVGPQGVGKSTNARTVCNALWSRWGVCYWVDLDLGQGEFLPSGTLSLMRVREPLVTPHQLGAAEPVAVFYVGAPLVNEAFAVARAIEALARVVNDAKAQAASARQPFPIVINTHGWVYATGRRATVEALRRLDPTAVVNFLTQGGGGGRRACGGGDSQEEHDGGDWTISAGAFQPVNGLNAMTVSKRFCLPHWPVLPSVEAVGPVPTSTKKVIKTSAAIFSLRVKSFPSNAEERAFVRRRAWHAYFYPEKNLAGIIRAGSHLARSSDVNALEEEGDEREPSETAIARVKTFKKTDLEVLIAIDALNVHDGMATLANHIDRVLGEGRLICFFTESPPRGPTSDDELNVKAAGVARKAGHQLVSTSTSATASQFRRIAHLSECGYAPQCVGFARCVATGTNAEDFAVFTPCPDDALDLATGFIVGSQRMAHAAVVA